VYKRQPYDQPFLGILPRRDVDEQADGIVVRHVYEQGPAAQGGLQPGDKITGVDDQDLATTSELRGQVAGLEPDQQVEVRYTRDGQPGKANVVLGRLPTAIPASLPPAHPSLPAAEAELPPTGVVDITIPEYANKCVALVPENYDARIAHSLVVWLHAPGKYDLQQLQQRWQAKGASERLILLAPQSQDPQRWTPIETEFIRKTMDDVISRYSVDPSRVVLHGDEAGGAMAYLVALGNRDLARAVIPVNAGLPRRVARPTTDPEPVSYTHLTLPTTPYV
jgi:serine protease Do